MQKNTRRTKPVDVHEPGTAKEGDEISQAKDAACPQSISVAYNKNGVATIYVLMSDGSILYKTDLEDEWKATSIGVFRH